ncbi:Highly reducing polyketide synthase FUM1 [Colletotrichum fructicola]|nr:Highly reducing polyketide synthase FUM1 [Colletotrichum fructicola]
MGEYIHSSSEPFLVAVCGLGLRAPGDIRNATDYWDLLVNGRDARGPIPDNRYNIDGFNDALGGKNTIKTRFGYFLADDLTRIDTSLFSMSRREVDRCDPQQRLLLEVAREALEDAGETNYRGERIGCYVGTFGDDWAQIAGKETQHQGGLGYVATGNGDLMLSNRVSYEYDLRGPSMTIKTGCSASLAALHEAFRSIQDGDATGAIIGGTSLIMTPTTTAAFTSEGILSPDGSCKSFDAKADGFARAEAINAIYIKPLSAAIRDGNAIRAVIRATGANNDGHSQGLFTPNQIAQEALMRKVYRDAGLDPSQTAYVECHGTGTATGDPIETSAVGEVFGEKGVYIGSVKPNIGHSEGASGLNSLIKAVLALEHKTIPPNIKFNEPNPKIPFADKKLTVPTLPTPWPADRAERISINSFGIGGTNAHVILESYGKSRPIVNGHGTSHPELLLMSANTAASLKGQVDRYQEFVALHPEVNKRDIAYTLATKREALPHRAFTIVHDDNIIETSAPVKAPSKAPDVYFIFSGQGAQWPEMAKQLVTTDPLFEADLKRMDCVLKSLAHRPRWSIIDELLEPATTSRIGTAELSQPLCTAIQLALVNRLRAAGVKPTAVVGHSSGEIAAAYAAGVITLEAAIICAYYRGYVTKQQTLAGSMAAIGLGPKDVSKFLVHGVVVACENSAQSSTISGDKEKVTEVIARIKAEMPDVLARPLKVDMAYHSHHMAALGKTYTALLEAELQKIGAWSSSATSLFFSSVTGEVLDKSFSFGPDYWRTNLVSPVRFSTAVSRLVETQGDGFFLEIGPHSALAGPLRQICSQTSCPCNYASCLIRGDDGVKTLLSCFGRLFQEGLHLNLGALYSGGKTLNDLPTYAFDHSLSLWYESRVSLAWRQRKYPHHALLGARVPESPDTAPQWRNILSLEDEPWIVDHKVKQDIVYPFAGYVAIAGEAVRQMTGVNAGYSIRHTVAHSALVLNHEKATELMTTLRRHPLTDSDHSEWFEFTIASYNGATWTKHCEGQVKALDDELPSTLVREDYPRKVVSSRFYDYMGDVGINFGPEFRRLENVTSSTTEALASADITVPGEEISKPYVMHPVAIDACFQLLILSYAKGLGRNVTQLSVPTLIKSLDIRRGDGSLTARAWGSSTTKSEGVECVSNGKTALRLNGFKLTALEESNDADYDEYAAARLEWLPDFDFVDVAPLFKPPPSDREVAQMIEELTLLCIIESCERLRGLSPAQPHFAKLRDWIDREVHGAREGGNALVPDSAKYLKLTREARRAKLEDLHKRLLNGNKSGLVEGLKRVVDNAERIFKGEAETIDILMEGGILAELYNAVSFGYSDFVKLMSSTKPKLRILEVGAGTGGTTELILRDLMHEGGLPRYSSYTFTDVSAGFFPQAKERFAYAPNMEYKVFDISKDPLEQDFIESSYDVIFAANVVHATPSLKDTLSNLNKVLKPGGALVLTEICTELRSPTYIFGNFVGWWLGENDGRLYAPYVHPSRWHSELLASGFTGVETAVYDEDAPYMCCTTIMSRRCRDLPPRGTSVTLITGDVEGTVAQSLSSSLTDAGFSVAPIDLGDPLPKDQDIISCVDIEWNLFENINQNDFYAFRDLIRGQGVNQNLLWLTNPVQVKCKDPRSAQTIGAARTIRTELANPFHTLEISKDEPNFNDLVLKVFGKIRREEDDDNLVSDKEFVVDNGTICIGRYHPFSLQEELSQRSIAGQETIQSLQIGKIGSIESLYWAEQALPQDIPADTIEVEPKSIGLNLKDVLTAMGVINPVGSVQMELGIELGGVVTRVGSDVDEFKVGDRVFAFAPEGCLATKAVLQRYHAAKLPDNLSFQDAAGVPVVFATVIHGLINIGHLQKDQSVLIHAGCGGVGLSAIQICRMIGAEIFVTVGSPDKVDYLMKTYDIPRNRIFHSRDESFLDGVMRETGGRGVDLVLNSLTGPLLHASWKCVAEFGMMVEIGKRDLLGYGKLDLNPFIGSRQYVGFDGVQFARKRPRYFRQLLEQFLGYWEQGHIRPIPEQTHFHASDIVNAFRHLQHGSHIGKVIVSMDDLSAQIDAKPLAKSIKFDPEATYLLTGGLGGLGKSMSTWLVEHGARHLTIISRSAGVSDESKAAIKEIESLGARVVAVAGGVENMDDVKAAISASSKPIKGVFHLAMVLRDSPMVDMTWEQWGQVAKPKVTGAWNLHHALSNQRLDFFWLASSVVTVVDQPGQGNYSAASTYLEAFTQYRLGLGLPTAVLNICPIKGVGFVAESAVAQRNTKAQGIYFLGEKKYLDYVEHSIFAAKGNLSAYEATPSSRPPKAWKNESQVVMGLRSELHLEDPNNRCNWRRDRRMGAYHNIRNKQADESGGDSSALKTFLNLASENPDLLSDKANIEFLAQEIGAKVYDFMLKPGEDVDTSLSLAQIGLDSLMATELRRWFRQLLGLQVSVLEIMASGSLFQLAETASTALKNKALGSS